VDAEERYDVALAESKRIIDEADPEGLLAMGAPSDEYDAFAAQVARRLLHGEDPLTLVAGWEEWNGSRDRDWFVRQLAALQQRLLPSA
jgi:hypothetical protein